MTSGSARRQRTSPEEIRSLLGLVDRDLEQANAQGLYPDGRYGFIYNAALQLANVILRLNDLRVGSPGRHQETFREVEKFVPASLVPLVTHFEHARRKRNVLMYDRAGAVSEGEAKDLREATIEFETWVRGQTEQYLGGQK